MTASRFKPDPVSLRDPIQVFVLLTRAHWPFSLCYQALYRLATALFARACGRFPHVAAAYVRSTLADGTFTAGVSDIDLTVVLRTGLPPEEEYVLLRRLWARYSLLRALFPMLGEMDVIDESQIETWLRFSRRTPHPLQRRLIAGRDVLAGRDTIPDGRWRTRALKDALWFYLDRLQPAAAKPRSTLQASAAQRIGRKILRLLNAPEQPLPAGPAELVRCVLAHLDRAVAANGPVRNGAAATSLLLDSANRRFLVGPVRSAVSGDAVPLTPALFEFYVRQYDPAEYERYDRSRKVLSGPDPLAQIAPPDAASGRAAALDQVPNVLLFPRSERMFRSAPNSRAEEASSVSRRAQKILAALGSEPEARELPPLDKPEEIYRHFRKSAEEVSRALRTGKFACPAKTGSR